MQAIANARGGICLSKKYINTHTPLLWQRQKGHRWKTLPTNVKAYANAKGSWCPECALERNRGPGVREPLTIEEMQDIAKRLGGRCLSRTYTNAQTHLLWECAKGHRWEAKPCNTK